jgi:hypothetical protein
MSNWHRGFTVVVLSAGACLAACTRPVDPNAPPSASLRSDEASAAQQIAVARCARLDSESCSSPQSYPSSDVCVNEKLQQTTLELRIGHCDERIDKKGLKSCVDELLAEPCGAGVRIDACNNDHLCPGFAPQEGASITPSARAL